jgi:hypothetical protein
VTSANKVQADGFLALAGNDSGTPTFVAVRVDRNQKADDATLWALQIDNVVVAVGLVLRADGWDDKSHATLR